MDPKGVHWFPCWRIIGKSCFINGIRIPVEDEKIFERFAGVYTWRD